MGYSVSERREIAGFLRKGFGWLLCIVAAILYLYGRENTLPFLVMALIPWVVLVLLLTRKGRPLFGDDPASAMPFIMGLPAVFAVPLIWPRLNMIDLGHVYLYALPLAAAFGLLFGIVSMRPDAADPDDGVIADPATNFKVGLALGALFGLGLNAGLLLDLNAAFQPQNAQMLSGQVQNRFETQGKHSTPYLYLSGTAPEAFESGFSDGAFKVDWDRYRQARVGAKACVAIHTGLLRLRWYEVVVC